MTSKRFTVALADRHDDHREPESRSPKVLLYSHDTFGLGNIRRTLLLAKAIIAAALQQMRYGRTCLAITHRLALFDHADVVYRLEDGRIAVQPPGLRLVSARAVHGA